MKSANNNVIMKKSNEPFYFHNKRCRFAVDPTNIFCTSLALFSSEKISDFGTVALSFVCGKYCPIID